MKPSNPYEDLHRAQKALLISQVFLLVASFALLFAILFRINRKKQERSVSLGVEGHADSDYRAEIYKGKLIQGEI